jgi:hypothetical protein
MKVLGENFNITSRDIGFLDYFLQFFWVLKDVSV